MKRRALFGAAGLLPVAFVAPVIAEAATPGVVVRTFLKARDGRDEDLARFLILNWLAMDRVAIDAGLFTHAVLHRTVDDPDSDFVVEVGYVDPGGYAVVADRFSAIRAAHATVLIGGLGFADLGTIVDERSDRPVACA